MDEQPEAVQVGKDATHAVVEFPGGLPPEVATLVQQHPDEFVVLNASGFNAPDPSTVELMLALTPYALRTLAGVVKTEIDSRRHSRVKVDGVEITGMSGRSTRRVLEELAKQREG
jgi:hypothetical protein